MNIIRNLPGPLLIFLGALSLSFGGLIVKSFEGATLWQILFWRSLFFSLTVLTFLIISYRRKTLESFFNSGLPGFIGGIVLSWFLSPLFSGLIATIVFAITRSTVLRKDFNSSRINWAYPILIGSTMTINTFFIIYKGAKGLGLDKTPLDIAFGVAFGIGGISAIITLPLVPKLKKYVDKQLKTKRSN